MSICLYVYLCKCLSVSMSICPYVYLSQCLSVPMSIRPYVYLSLCLSISMSICPYVYLSLCLSVPMSICPYVYLSLCLSVPMSICPYVYVCLMKGEVKYQVLLGIWESIIKTEIWNSFKPREFNPFRCRQGFTGSPKLGLLHKQTGSAIQYKLCLLDNVNCVCYTL